MAEQLLLILLMFCKIHDGDEFHDLPLEKLLDISSDGPNINKAIWWEFNAKLTALGYKGLINLITCTLHVVHNAFRAGMKMNGLGQMIDQLILSAPLVQGKELSCDIY